MQVCSKKITFKKSIPVHEQHKRIASDVLRRSWFSAKHKVLYGNDEKRETMAHHNASQRKTSTDFWAREALWIRESWRAPMAASKIQNVHCLVLTSANNVAPICLEGHRAKHVGVPSQGLQAFTTSSIPNLHRLVRAPIWLLSGEKDAD